MGLGFRELWQDCINPHRLKVTYPAAKLKLFWVSRLRALESRRYD